MSAQSGVKTERGESLRESVRQALFQATSNKALQLPSGYLKVAVLIIRWDESIDDFKEKHTEEVGFDISRDSTTALKSDRLHV